MCFQHYNHILTKFLQSNLPKEKKQTENRLQKFSETKILTDTGEDIVRHRGRHRSTPGNDTFSGVYLAPFLAFIYFCPHFSSLFPHIA